MATEQNDRVTRLAAALHRAVCQSPSVVADCRRPDGGEHARRTQRAVAREALAAEDPAVFLHERMCDAILDPTFGRCPDEERHVEAYRRTFLSDPGESVPS